MFFTSLPVLIMGVFDQDVNDEYSLRFPKLYVPGQYNLFFNMRIFIYSIIHGMLRFVFSQIYYCLINSCLMIFWVEKKLYFYLFFIFLKTF